MQFDASTSLTIFDRKRARLDTLATVAERHLWYDALVRLMRWVLREPMLRAYVKRIAEDHDAEERAVMRQLRGAVDRLAASAKAFRAKCKSASELSPGWPTPLTWATFEDALAGARADGCSNATWRDAVSRASMILAGHAKQALDDALRASQDAETSLEKATEHHKMLLIAKEAGATDVEATATLLAEAKAAFDVATEKRAVATAAFDKECKLAKAVFAVTNRYTPVLKLWTHEEEHSSRAALARLLRVCRGFAPPRDGVAHWTDVLDEDRWEGHIASRELQEKPEAHAPEAARDLGRLAEELHVMGASSLSHGVVVERFAERCAWYDRERMRRVAGEGSGKREDRLTLELAKYMHDCGVFVLVRPRVSNLEPDLVALRGLAVEAKAYTSSANARRELIDGYYQLHAYMTSLETRAARVHEGFLVAFRVSGPIYETPRTMTLGRFLIHSLTIDLGESKDSGRKQPRPEPVSEKEIREAVTAKRTTARSG